MSKWFVALAVTAIALGIFLVARPKRSAVSLAPETSGSLTLPGTKSKSPPVAATSNRTAQFNATAVTPSDWRAAGTVVSNLAGTAGPAAAAKIAAAAFLPPLTNVAPAFVMDNMRTTIRLYADRYKGNPVGTNPEITEALNGGNPGKVRFINLEPDSGLRINGSGELVDAWGAPFFFHQLSATEMEIRSPGPDHVLFTEDDLVIK